METMINDKKEIRGWAMYDWANSAFSTTVGTVFLGPYIATLATADRKLLRWNGKVLGYPHSTRFIYAIHCFHISLPAGNFSADIGSDRRSFTFTETDDAFFRNNRSFGDDWFVFRN